MYSWRTQAVSIALCWDHVRHRPIVLAVLGVAALMDTLSEQLQVSLMLGVFHVTIWVVDGRYNFVL